MHQVMMVIEWLLVAKKKKIVSVFYKELILLVLSFVIIQNEFIKEPIFLNFTT